MKHKRNRKTIGNYQKRRPNQNMYKVDNSRVNKIKKSNNINIRRKKRLERKRKQKIRRFLFFLFLIVILLVILIYKLVTNLLFKFKFSEIPNFREFSNDILTKDVVISDTSNRELTVAEKKSDFNQVYDLIVENFPRVEDNISNYFQFTEEKATFEEKINKTKNDYEFYNLLKEYLNILEDDKTTILSAYQYMESVGLLDKEYYEKNSPYYEILNDSRVSQRYSKINKLSEEIYTGESFLELKKLEDNIGYISVKNLTIENKEEDHEKIVEFIKSLTSNTNLIIDLRDSTGSSDSYWVENFVKPISNSTYTAHANILFSNPKSSNYMDYLSIEENVEYFDLSDDRISLDNISQIDKSQYENMLYSKGMTYSVSSNNEGIFNGDVYIIQNENTEGSAETFSYFANNSDFATVVGRSSSGNGVDVRPFLYKLDHSGFVLSIDSTRTLDNEYIDFNKMGNQAEYPLEEPLLENLINKIKNYEL